MSWWQWVLTCIGMYVGTGLVVAALDAYREGVIDSRRDNPDAFAYDADYIALNIFAWPILVLLDWTPAMYKKFYARGKSRANRKLIRQGKKAQDKAFKDLCKQNGWDYKKMRPLQDVV